MGLLVCGLFTSTMHVKLEFYIDKASDLNKTTSGEIRLLRILFVADSSSVHVPTQPR